MLEKFVLNVIWVKSKILEKCDKSRMVNFGNVIKVISCCYHIIRKYTYMRGREIPINSVSFVLISHVIHQIMSEQTENRAPNWCSKFCCYNFNCLCWNNWFLSWSFIGTVCIFLCLNFFMSAFDVGTDIWTGQDLIR